MYSSGVATNEPKKKMAFMAIRRQIDEFLSKTEQKKGGISKTYCKGLLSTFLVVSARKNICLHPETVTRNIHVGQGVEESLRGGKLVKNLEIILNE